jgi:hypothetical protein
MTSKTKLALAASLALLSPVGFAMGESLTREGAPVPVVKIQYVRKPATDADFSRLWRDVLDQIPASVLSNPAVPNEINATSVKFPDGRTLTFTMLSGTAACGNQDCPERILEDGRVIFDGRVCSNVDGHFVTSDAETLMACDRPYAIPPKR